MREGWPRCIHLAGPDGTGKTTQTRSLLGLLKSRNIVARQVWLRFPRLFCTPFLVYARLRGYSHREIVDGHEHGYWDFESSWLMSKLFPWVQWLDTLIIALFRIYLPLRMGRTLICDRFVVDIVVELMVGLNAPRFDAGRLGRLYMALLPRDTKVVILDLETEIARERSPELRGDRSQPQRRRMYLDLARRHSWPVISTVESVEITMARLVQVIEGTAIQGAGEPAEMIGSMTGQHPHQRA